VAGVDKVYANESQNPGGILERDGLRHRVFTENAEQLNNVLPKDVKPNGHRHESTLFRHLQED
jgi:hypothetical protein